MKTITIMTLALLFCQVAGASTLPEVKEGDVILKDFTFHTGETLPELKVHYRTMGDPSGAPVLILHGTTGSGASMLGANFAGQLFCPGQVLDAAKHYIIFPDSIGTGQTSKPSDGLHARFPRYNYDDMVLAQYRLLTEGLGVQHVKVIIGNSMGGMNAWTWAVNYPDYMDVIVPMASQPGAMSGRNWMMRRMVVDAVRNDPAWKDGEYTEQPEHFRLVNVWFGIATNGGTLNYLSKAPTSEAGDRLVAERMASLTRMDANDYMYQWDASRDFNPEPKLDRIKCWVFAVNAADDERCPAESGVMEGAMSRLEKMGYYLIPASKETSGHGTVMNAKFWCSQFEEFLKAHTATEG